MGSERLNDYAFSVAAVLDMWATHALSRGEVLDMLRAVGLTDEQSEAIIVAGVTQGVLRERGENVLEARITPEEAHPAAAA